MTAKDASRELQVSLSFVYKLMDQGEITYERRGTRKLPVDQSVEEYKRRNLVAASAEQHRPVKGPAPQFSHLFTARKK